MTDTEQQTARAELALAGFLSERQAGRQPNLQTLFRSAPPIVLTGVLVEKLVDALGHNDTDPNPDPRDWRRASTFLAGWATGDPAIFGPVTEEAEQDGRTQHLLVAIAEHAVLGLGLRDNPEQLAEIRRAIAIWMNEENRND